MLEGGFIGTLLFFVLALKAALGPPRPQERASGAVGPFFRRTGVWHTANSPWTIPVGVRASAEGISRQPPPPHGSLHSAAFGAWIIVLNFTFVYTFFFAIDFTFALINAHSLHVDVTWVP